MRWTHRASTLSSLNSRTRLAPATVVFLIAAAWCTFVPLPLTDGDSSLFAAIGSEMASGGWQAWVAPHWAYQGRPELFYEHPPGAFWPMAMLEKLGVPDDRAALLANLLWLALLLYGMWHLAGKRLPGGGPGLGLLAAGVLLLHYPLWKYVVRASLEIPFAACVTCCVAAARSTSLKSPAWLALAMFGAWMVRGIFAGAVPLFLVADAWFNGRHSIAYRAKLLVGLLLGLGMAALFDVAHAQATGHGFWSAYTDKQVLPSLEGGAPHPNQGATLLYYGGRLFLYSLPWCLVAALGLWASRRKPAFRAQRRHVITALLWAGSFFVGIVIAKRQGSRYLFAVWPATAWMASIGLEGWWRSLAADKRRMIAAGVLALVPVLTVGKGLVTADDEWSRAAASLRAYRADAAEHSETIPPVYGPFAGHDDRMKQFVRHHLGVWAFQVAPDGPPPGSILLVTNADPAHAGEAPLLRTDLFALVAVP